jgi:hypothetical protein
MVYGGWGMVYGGMRIFLNCIENGQFQVKVKVVDIITNVDSLGKTLKSIPGISQLFNFEFETNGLRVWKAYKDRRR